MTSAESHLLLVVSQIVYELANRGMPPYDLVRLTRAMDAVNREQAAIQVYSRHVGDAS